VAYKRGEESCVNLCKMSFADAFEKAILISILFWGVVCPVLFVVVTLLGALLRDLTVLITIHSDMLAFCAVACGVHWTRLRLEKRAELAAQEAAAAAEAAAQAAWNAAAAAESEDTDDNEDWSDIENDFD
jgi:hypothetical protein